MDFRTVKDTGMDTVSGRVESERAKPGLRFERRNTRAGSDPLGAIEYELRDSVITNPDGSVVFELRGAEVPASWSQLATDIAVSKYFRKAGIHGDPKLSSVWRNANIKDEPVKAKNTRGMVSYAPAGGVVEPLPAEPARVRGELRPAAVPGAR